MIEITNLTKRFQDFTALDGITTGIPKGSVFGLVGSNGSGKSTLMRLISGVYHPDGGRVTVNGATPDRNTKIREEIAFVPDDPHFFSHSTLEDMAAFYKGVYPKFDRNYLQFLIERFPIDSCKRIGGFSKGMKRQASLILALSCKPSYLLLDEAFDGLDPVMRGALRKMLADQIAEREMTTIIASHNLRELEDLCDHVGLLHQGHLVFQKEIDEDRLGFCKVQVVFSDLPDEHIFSSVKYLQKSQSGSVVTMIVKGSRAETEEALRPLSPLLVESVPLTLEEVFIHEMEAVGYDYNNILF